MVTHALHQGIYFEFSSATSPQSGKYITITKYHGHARATILFEDGTKQACSMNSLRTLTVVNHLMVEICQSATFHNHTGYETRDLNAFEAYEDAIEELAEVMTRILRLEDVMHRNHETQLAQIRQNDFSGTTDAQTNPHGHTHSSKRNPDNIHGNDP